MKRAQRFEVVCFLATALSALSPACSSSDAPATIGSAGAGTAGASTGSGDATRGAMYFKTVTGGCNLCHGNMAEGGQGPNITSSVKFGIGSWTEADFLNALRNGIGKGGKVLCPFMNTVPPSVLSDSGVADMYAFLMSTPANETTILGSSKGTYLCP
ncbi:MAG: c-type cytochrome [Myxococcales bacterium]